MYKTFPLIFILIFSYSCSLEEIEKENINRVKNIDKTEVKQISIQLESYHYKRQNNKLQKILLNENEIAQFLSCLKSLSKFHPNHPQYPNCWYGVIELLDGTKEEIRIYQRIGDYRNLYVECIGHSFIGSAAVATSSSLYGWMEDNCGLLASDSNIKAYKTKEDVQEWKKMVTPIN